ncbi:DUF2911 domain-containing protein [Pontibacter anaerobius]|uniref:DUF2911 domain-containing protein n=1 Tax=Pontibacter anaerobius TaxID=2993940 RepID=A0ABT3RHF7_9BACT|nr:DUF2911 domain-containing protein [Pontibacter anaerobius]MCX2741278.1 DUF2911 domain-containing protein [Pontibacter anaerobius]
MNKSKLVSMWLLLLGMVLSFGASAQGGKASPADSVSGQAGDATITVNYSSPSVKGRNIWGGLVPYGQVWRAGANEATTVTVDKDVLVEGERLPAGTYSFYTLPGEDEWIVIFNKTAKQWGTQYDEKQDALRVKVTPRKAPAMNERLKYDVTDEGLLLSWENLEVPVKIEAVE